jgi:beta-barrel assembly-enhancing protease
MKLGITRLMIALLAASLLFAIPALAQTTAQSGDQASAQTGTPASTDPKAQESIAKETKRKLEEARKEEEKKKKEEEKAAKEAAKKAPQKKNSDIENIGNRDINKGGFHPMTPGLESEIALGRQVSRELEAQVTLVQDPMVTEYVNRVGQNLVKNSDSKIPFQIKVIDSDEINAVSLPGGFFYVNTGLILAADEEAELAAVMAHEIAHVTARHAAEQQGRASFVNILSVPASIFTGGIVGAVVQQSAGILLPVAFYSFNRKSEEEADWLGLQYMYKAGYDPGASVSFFEKLQARETARKKVSSLFSTHPATEERVRLTKYNIENFLAPREQYLVSTSEFDRVKAHLAQIQNQKTPSEKERAPSLRRRTPSQRNPNPDDGDSKDKTGAESKPEDREPDADAPPVLKRPQDRPQ